MSLAFALASLVAAQAPAPFERAAIDPYLPEELRPVVERANEAERDPKRGSTNALEVIAEAKRAYPDKQEYQLALRLREAGIVLRKHFLDSKRFPLVLRYEQVLSTFARLDLTEPGFHGWLTTTLDNHPKAKQRYDKAAKTLPIAVLIRGQQLDKKAFAARLGDALAPLGLKVRLVPPKKARFVVKLGAENPKRAIPGRRAVRIIMGIEGILDGETTWTHTIFRTAAAKDTEGAIDSAVDWLVRVGGRDMLFRWLGETAFPSLVAADKKNDPHAGHGH